MRHIFAILFIFILSQELVFCKKHKTKKQQSPIYLIGTAETPSLNLPGLTPIGQERADTCLPRVLGPLSGFNIGYILACQPANDTGECITAPLTVQPLATALGLTVDTSCSTSGEDDSDDNCVSDAIDAFMKTSNKSILICWDPSDMDDLTEALNVDDTPDFPTGNYDVIFQLSGSEFVQEISQNCTGVDGQSAQSIQLFGTTPLPDEDSDDAFVVPQTNQSYSQV